MQSYIPKSNIYPPLGIFLSVLTGILIFLSFVYLPYLSFVSLIPLLFLIDRASSKSSFYFGLITGFSLYILMLSFIFKMEVPNRFYLYLGVFILWFYLSLYYGIWCLLTKIMLSKLGSLGWLVSATLFVSFEFIRSLTSELGFPWGSIGYTLVPQRYFIQISDVTGIAGLSLLVIAINILLYKSFKRPKLTLPLIIVAMSGTLCYSYFRIGFLQKTFLSIPREIPQVSVLVVQPNLSHEIKRRGDIASRIETFRYFSTTNTRHDLIIWPESSLPGYLIKGSNPERLTSELVDSLGTKVLTGGTRLSYDEGNIKVYNSAVLVEPNVGAVDFYDKIYLVPFGERLPLDQFFPALQRLQFGQGTFTPGKRRTLFCVDESRFGVLICFESIFPRLVRKFIKDGADFMVNITDDSWFGRTVGPYEHARMATLRAVETRKTFIRCANAGISYIVTPLGEVRNKTGLFESSSVSDYIQLNSVQTFYTKYGDVFSYVILLITLIGVALTVKRIHRDK